MDYQIRAGKVSDLVQVLELINELATIKKRTVDLTIYDLIKDGFSMTPLYKLFIAEKNDEIIGFVMYYKSYSTNGKSLIIEDVFVSQNHKKLGVGLDLFAKILDIANRNNIQRIEWGLLERFKSLVQLYERAGATILRGSSVFEMDENAINKVLENELIVSANSFKQVITRKGESKDMAEVLDLIKELATYKKSSCDITVYDLLNDGFTKDPFFSTIVLEVDTKVVGVLLFYHSYAAFKGKSLILEDLHIKEEYRKYGYGKALNYAFFEYAKEKDIKRIEQVIFDHDKAAIDRCLAFGAKKIEGFRLVQISQEALLNFINK